MTDIGSWEMELINTEGEIYKYRGSLCEKIMVDGINISELLRDALGMQGLYGFERC